MNLVTVDVNGLRATVRTGAIAMAMIAGAAAALELAGPDPVQPAQAASIWEAAGIEAAAIIGEAASVAKAASLGETATGGRDGLRPPQAAPYRTVGFDPAPYRNVGLDPAQQRAAALDSGPCVVTATQSAAPPVVLLGDPVSVTLQVAIGCPEVPPVPVHLMLALEASERSAGSFQEDVREAALLIVDSIRLGPDSESRVGVVEFNDSARTLCPLTNDASALETCIRRTAARGGVRIDSGLAQAGRELRMARRGAPVPPDELVAIVSAGPETGSPCDVALREATALKSQGVLVLTVCVNPDCDDACMRRLASSPRYFFWWPRDGWPLRQVFQLIRSSVGPPVRRLVITDTLPIDMEPVTGSAHPAATQWDPLARAAVWDLYGVQPSGVTISLAVQPLEVGVRATSVEALGWYDAWQLGTGSFSFNVPVVSVVEATVVPTTTGPTGTATASPTSTAPTPPPSPTTSPTPTTRHQILLPLVVASDWPVPPPR